MVFTVIERCQAGGMDLDCQTVCSHIPYFLRKPDWKKAFTGPDSKRKQASTGKGRQGCVTGNIKTGVNKG